MKPFDPQKEGERIIEFIRSTFAAASCTHAVIGVSGGVDSAVSLVLLVKALGAEHVTPILLPYGALNTEGVIDAMLLIEKLAIPLSHVIRLDIKYAVDVIVGKEMIHDVRKGNIMARVRMIYLFDQAKKKNALVAGTENKTEQMLGYFTRFGDAASDIEPIVHLYKTEVCALARHLVIPEKICTKAPTAGLWPGQTDEGELGFSYADADAILSLLYDEKLSLEEVVKKGYDRMTVEGIKARVEANLFKRVVPYTIG